LSPGWPRVSATGCAWPAERVTGAGPAQLIGDFRTEHDSLGERELPDEVYYGVQTLRAMENFAISGVFVKNFEHMIEALAFVKKAAAQANCELGVLDETRMKAICNACDELLAGQLHDQFTVDMFQGGAGTSTNMMANEVIANRGLEILGYKKGRVRSPAPQRPRQLLPVDQRCLPHGDQAGRAAVA
jgi:aspartate ammonia-lyase